MVVWKQGMIQILRAGQIWIMPELVQPEFETAKFVLENDEQLRTSEHRLDHVSEAM